MRPLKLTIQAFGPYIKPVTLDFEKNLRDKKIFLIHGATGAGKTTILDAICFALYGKASGEERDAAMMRSKGVSDKTATVVEFSFALGEKIYNVRRTLTYNPNRKNNKNQIDAELRRDGQVIETQATRVTNAITELLGFKPEQFRQVVLLPQGEFKNFLSANSADRQPILDALFNAALYSLIENKLKLKADDAQNKYEDLVDKREALIAPLQGAKLDDSVLEKLSNDYDAAVKECEDLEENSNAAQNEYSAAQSLSNDFNELDSRNEALQKAQNNLVEAEKKFTTAKDEYDLRNAQQPQRDKLKSDVEKLNDIKNVLEKELEPKREALTDADDDLKKATETLNECESNAETFDDLLKRLEERRDKLTGADDILKTLQEIEERERELKRALRKISDAEKNYNDAQIELERLQKLQHDGSAALLAKNLRDGEPCPVCGSTNHPQLAFREEIIPSDEEVKKAQSEVDKLKKNLDKAKISVAKIQSAIDTKRADLKKFDNVPDKDTAKKNADELADCKRRIETGKRLIAENNSALEPARNAFNEASRIRAQRLGEWQTVKKRIPQIYLDNSSQLNDDIKAIQDQLSELENAWKNANKNFREAGNEKSSCETALETAQDAQRKFADKLKGKQPPDIGALKTFAETAQKKYNDAFKKKILLGKTLEDMTELSKQLAALDKKISVADKDLRVWKKLSDAAGGKISGNKLSFARYYLSAMFEEVLTEANYRLEKMSDHRYNLQSRKAGERSNSKLGLNLEIFDDYTGTTRPVETLSGGESFLASLSLALGLAAVVQNNSGGIKLDTIFIDEGFGTLDTETLDFAMKTLIDLQSGGRLVGIISHVEELKNQMPVRLEITKGKTGSTARFVS